ncbi:MAG: oligoendopeptidase F [Nitrospinaceae bacterium]|jgi:oligoendopeptidase F|nr:MAG: oligoendopeptidase F [Nitrospinaceae bacterium]
MEAIVGPITREAIPEESTWDLSGLYVGDADWQAEMKVLEAEVARYEDYRGTLANSAASLAACLKFDMEVSRRLDRLYTYAHLKNDEDKTVTFHQGNYERITRLATRLSQASSFIRSEVMAIDEERMQLFLDDEALEFFRLYLERMLRYRDHTLSAPEEALLAAASEVGRAAREGFEMLDNADLKLGSVTDSGGRRVDITHGNFQSLMQSYDRDLRRGVFERFYSAYSDHRYTYASLLASSIKKDIFFARSKKHDSVRGQALFVENIPAQVYDNLIEAVHANLAPLYRYFGLRKRLLGYDALHAYDLSVPLVQDFHWSMEYPQAVDRILQALSPLGGEYTDTLKQGLLEGRWVDRYESKGKRSGAYSSGCYDSNPFILMNYKDDNINSVYTLAHEAGHSMHSHYSRSTQPYLYADYTIFVAEVASTFNEALLTRSLLAGDIDRETRIYLLCREIDNFRGTLYRQTQFAEFEHLVYRVAEEGAPLTVDTFMETYQALLERYFGDGVTLDEDLSLECFRIPHFYFSFYVYKYATGISAAYALAERVLGGGAGELADYLHFLKSGGSKYPLDLLNGAGVDMTSPEPVATALTRFSELVDQLEALTAGA